MDNFISTRSPIFKELVKEMEMTLSELDTISKEIKPCLNETMYLTSEEVRLTYNLSPRCIQKYRDNGIIPFVQIGRKILYPQDEIEKILDRHYAI